MSRGRRHPEHLRAVLGLLCLFALGAVHASSPGERFAQAAQAYDAEQFETAVTLYEGLVRDGFRAPELFFNLGNAHFRAGNMGAAVLYYKKAAHLAPRERAIGHNLEFALLQADAAHVAPSAPARWLRMLSLSEWALAATIAWWLTALSLVRVLWPSRMRRGWSGSTTLTALVLMFSLAGLMQWASLHFRPEVVVTQPGQEARFAPFDGSTAHFALPVGSVALVEERTDDGWYKVRVGEKGGYIRQTAATVIDPWKTGLE